MKDIHLRQATPDDAAAIARIRVENSPFVIFDAEIVAFRMRNTPPEQRERELVAELDGQVVAWGGAGLDLEEGDGLAHMGIQVDRRHRRAGIGTAVCQALLEHVTAIGANAVKAQCSDMDNAPFARRYGFTHTRVERVSYLSLDAVPDAPEPPGFDFVPASQLATPEPLYEVDVAISQDIPADEEWTSLPYSEWKKRYLADGRLNWECTVLAFQGDTPAAVAWLDTTGTRVWSGLTGTKRQFRGQGVAKALKVAALRRARDHGFRDAYTSNDATNAAMLAVNDWLGYRPYVEQPCYVKTLR